MVHTGCFADRVEESHERLAGLEVRGAAACAVVVLADSGRPFSVPADLA